MTPSKYLAEAEAELEDQFDAYDTTDPDVAGRFLEAVEEAVNHIREFPGIGPPLARGTASDCSASPSVTSSFTRSTTASCSSRLSGRIGVTRRSCSTGWRRSTEDWARNHAQT